MKKFLLVLCAAAGFCTLSAQKVSDFSANNAAVRNTVPFEAGRTVLMSVKTLSPFAAESATLYDVADASHEGSALYRAPYGSLYETMSPDWRGYSINFLYVPAQKDLTWVNYSRLDNQYASPEDVSWTMEISDDSVENLDSLMDEDGNLVQHFYGYYYVPDVSVYAPEDEQHTDALSSYWLYRGNEQPEQKSFLTAGTDTLVNLGYACIPAGHFSGFSDGGQFTSNTNFFVLEKKDEKGNVGFKDTGKKCVGFAQYIDSPSDMLYVTSVYMNWWIDGTYTEGNILEGKELTAQVFRVTEEGLSELVAEATADEDALYYESEYKLGAVTFKFVEDDPIFGKMEAPIVLDNTSDYIVVISGFEQLASEWTCVLSHADGFSGHGYALLEDGSFATIGYTNALSTPQVDLYISFEAAMPVAEIVETCKDVTVTIPAEGGYGVTVYDEEEQQWYNDFDIYTMNSSEWWEEIEAPGWVSIEYNDDYVERGLMAVFIKAGALPKNVTERHGDVIISLYGKEIVIPVAQGDVPGAVPVMTTDTEKKVYFNTLGQRELYPVQGRIYISDGQKEVF